MTRYLNHSSTEEASSLPYLHVNDPYNLLFNYTLSYEEKVTLLKTWRDERTRYLIECCRDMDYSNDIDMHAILQALQAIRNEPRRHQ